MPIGEIIANILLILGLFLTVFQLVMLNRQIMKFVESHNLNHEWYMKKAAQDALIEYRAIKDDVKALKIKFDYLKSPMPIDQTIIVQECESDPNLQNSIQQVFNYFEYLTRGVDQNIFHEQVIRDALAGTIIEISNKFQHYVQWREGINKNKALYERVMQYAELWSRSGNRALRDTKIG